MIHLKSINKSFEKKKPSSFSLTNINLKIHEDSVFGIIGRSGAGKTTLLNVMTKHVLPDSGEYYFSGQPVRKMPKQIFFRQIGIVYQGYPLLMQKNVFDNIALPLVIRHNSHRFINETVNHLLRTIGIDELKNHYPSELSGGQKQRVAIARALAGNPKVLFLDEPTSALDTFTTMELVTLLKKLHQQGDLTIVVISHDLNVIDALCDRTALIENGKIVACGETHAITKEITQSFPKEGDTDGLR